MKYILFCIGLYLSGCSPDVSNINVVYKNRALIVDLFDSKSILRSRGDNVIMFYTHNEKSTNKYFFQKEGSKYIFLNEIIEYTPDLLNLKNERKNEQLESIINELLEKMDSLAIRDISSEMKNVGIKLKLHLKSNSVVLYVPNYENIISDKFKDYVNSMKKLDENWYYLQYE